MTVSEGGDITGISSIGEQVDRNDGGTNAIPKSGGEPVAAPLAGTVIKVLVKPGQTVKTGDTVLMLEAMKMETNVSAHKNGEITQVHVNEGDSVSPGDVLLAIA